MKMLKKMSVSIVKSSAFARAKTITAASLISAPFMAFSTQAHAIKLSDLTSGMKNEIASIAPVWLLGIMALGICFAGVAVISGIIAKKNQEPLKWQVWGVVGGAIAIILPVILLSFAGSLSNDEGDAESVMSELNINY